MTPSRKSPGGRQAAVLFGIILAAACAPAKSKAPAEAVPVSVAEVVRKDVPVEIRNVGTVQPITSVAIRAQVTGALTGVHFREGQDVRAGDLLLSIDPRPYQAALDQAAAALGRDRAQEANAAAEEKRYADLVQKDYVTREQYDQVRANAAGLKATLQADQAAVENARLELAYCRITSPINGRTGSLMVQEGNLVKPVDTTLLTVNQISPIYLVFSVPESQLPAIRRRQSAEAHLSVDAEAASDGHRLGRGELTFIDNTVDRTTGTIMLKATFPNQDKTLWPGEYANAVLTLSTESNAIVAPASAIQTGQQGSYAYVVKSDETVESRVVTVSRQLGDSVIVASGLAAGERVVTDGQLRLANGSRIQIKEAGPAAGAKRS